MYMRKLHKIACVCAIWFFGVGARFATPPYPQFNFGFKSPTIPGVYGRYRGCFHAENIPISIPGNVTTEQTIYTYTFTDIFNGNQRFYFRAHGRTNFNTSIVLTMALRIGSTTVYNLLTTTESSPAAWFLDAILTTGSYTPPNRTYTTSGFFRNQRSGIAWFKRQIAVVPETALTVTMVAQLGTSLPPAETFELLSAVLCAEALPISIP